jgi:hypothetical protein
MSGKAVRNVPSGIRLRRLMLVVVCAVLAVSDTGVARAHSSLSAASPISPYSRAQREHCTYLDDLYNKRWEARTCHGR